MEYKKSIFTFFHPFYFFPHFYLTQLQKKQQKHTKNLIVFMVQFQLATSILPILRIFVICFIQKKPIEKYDKFWLIFFILVHRIWELLGKASFPFFSQYSFRISQLLQNALNDFTHPFQESLVSLSFVRSLTVKSSCE